MTTIPNPPPTGAGEVPVAKHDQDAEVERTRGGPVEGRRGATTDRQRNRLRLRPAVDQGERSQQR